MLALFLACAPKPTATTTGATDGTSAATVNLGVEDFLNRIEPKIIECYMGTLQDPSLADDTVQLQYVIDGAGKVTRAVARQSTITDARFMDCVEKLMELQKVSNPSGNTLTVTRDYNFRPAK